jgi:general secretion pathway protein I
MLNFRDKSLHSKPLPSGFTLLEVLVSLAIIAIVFVSVLRLQGQTISMDGSFRFYSIAPFLAQAKMSEVDSDPSAYIGGDTGDFGDDAPGFSWRAEVSDLKLTGPKNAILDMQEAVVTVVRKSDGLKYVLKEYLTDNSGTS